MATSSLEQRVEALEQELAKLKSRIESAAAAAPWWEHIAGSFAGDPIYERAMKLGRQYRASFQPGSSSRGTK